MSLRFRNLSVTPDSPASRWPTEAVQTALDRGYLEDWRRIAAELDRSPWGPIARKVDEVLSFDHPYGIATAMHVALTRARARAEVAERAEVAAEIRSAIERSGLTQAEFASRIGTSRTRLSTYASGKVTPSAAMFVRIRRFLDGLDADDTPHPGVDS